MLGEISWRGPFYGVAPLMAVALIATITLVQPTPLPARKTRLSAPLQTLRHRGLLTMSITALSPEGQLRADSLWAGGRQPPPAR